MSYLKEHQLKLKMIFEELQMLIEKYSPKEMAIEAPFYGKKCAVHAEARQGAGRGDGSGHYQWGRGYGVFPQAHKNKP